jgi:signal peptidase II
MRLPPTDNFRSPGALLCFLLTAGIGVFLDLWTKVLAVTHLKDARDVIAFIPGWLHFEYTENKGAVFGLGQGQRILFLVVSVAAILFLIWLFLMSDRQRVYQIILGMLLAGVIGNMYDRLVYGYVRDMIHAVPRWPSVFPWIFNVADSLLCVGVFLMVVYSLLHKPKEQEPGEPMPPARRGFETVSVDPSERS